MNVETIINYINIYGYFVIFLFLFFGIVGIPAPEESLLFLIGVLSFHHQLSLGLAMLCSILGAFTGMLAAYSVGKFVGFPFIKKYGKYAGITADRWEMVSGKYTTNVRKTILIGFYLPGIRQISPYFAGINNIPFRRFLFFSMIGTFLWTIPFIVGGYFAGKVFHINPDYVPYVGIAFFFLFSLYMIFKYIKGKRRNYLNRHTNKT
ncbi:DedA family protein [Neobacillus sp. MER 74]|uniref:DedA family protein n=1 Tax=Neobacillus sp. MER 74 TaxID=2939566 RepID=UPI00203EB657|nr:DedA family protein [Neobacillus sp. MER 74]MCM3115282.1 DedA family protein [Neobacillus sp. MER 74]